jgi:hypothetical protein
MSDTEHDKPANGGSETSNGGNGGEARGFAALDQTASALGAAATIAVDAAGSAEAVSQAISDMNASGKHADTDPVAQFMSAMHERMLRVEAVIGLVHPVVAAASDVVRAVVPNAGPLVSRVSTIESLLGGILGMFSELTSGKITPPPHLMDAMPSEADQQPAGGAYPAASPQTVDNGGSDTREPQKAATAG